MKIDVESDKLLAEKNFDFDKGTIVSLLAINNYSDKHDPYFRITFVEKVETMLDSDSNLAVFTSK